MVKRKLRNTKSDLVLAYNSLLPIKTCCTGLLLFAISACQSTTPDLPKNVDTDSKPSWVMKLPQSNSIMYATGSSTIYADGSNAINRATESARVELAKSIRVTVSAETKVNQRSDNGDMSFYFDETIKNSVPDMELAGLKIIDSYLDKKTSTAYVLASFNKDEAIIEIRQLLTTNDDELAQTTVDLTGTAGQKLTQAIGVKKLLLKRRQYNDQLVNLRQSKVMLTETGQQLRAKSNQVFNSITFEVSKTADADLQDKIIKAITAQGLKVNNNAADFTLTYKIAWQDVTRNNLYYSIANATVTLKSGETVLNKFMQKAKGTSSDKSMARNKAIDKMGKQFTHVLSKELMASFSEPISN
jgi:hypothetical protein